MTANVAFKVPVSEQSYKRVYNRTHGWFFDPPDIHSDSKGKMRMTP